MKYLQAICLALLTSVGFAADPPLGDRPAAATATETSAVIDSATPQSCIDATPEHARQVADDAFRNEAYQRAGECYLAAGEQAMADRAFLKALAPQGEDTAHRLVANRDALKAQLHQWQDSLRHR